MPSNSIDSAKEIQIAYDFLDYLIRHLTDKDILDNAIKSRASIKGGLSLSELESDGNDAFDENGNFNKKNQKNIKLHDPARVTNEVMDTAYKLNDLHLSTREILALDAAIFETFAMLYTKHPTCFHVNPNVYKSGDDELIMQHQAAIKTRRQNLTLMLNDFLVNKSDIGMKSPNSYSISKPFLRSLKRAFVEVLCEKSFLDKEKMSSLVEEVYLYILAINKNYKQTGHTDHQKDSQKLLQRADLIFKTNKSTECKLRSFIELITSEMDKLINNYMLKFSLFCSDQSPASLIKQLNEDPNNRHYLRMLSVTLNILYQKEPGLIKALVDPDLLCIAENVKLVNDMHHAYEAYSPHYQDNNTPDGVTTTHNPRK